MSPERTRRNAQSHQRCYVQWRAYGSTPTFPGSHVSCVTSPPVIPLNPATQSSSTFGHRATYGIMWPHSLRRDPLTPFVVCAECAASAWRNTFSLTSAHTCRREHTGQHFVRASKHSRGLTGTQGRPLIRPPVTARMATRRRAHVASRNHILLLVPQRLWVCERPWDAHMNAHRPSGCVQDTATLQPFMEPISQAVHNADRLLGSSWHGSAHITPRWE